MRKEWPIIRPLSKGGSALLIIFATSALLPVDSALAGRLALPSCAVIGSRQANPGERDSAGLIFASARGDLAEVFKLLDEGADPNAHPGVDDYGTPLAWAARCNHPRTAAALIRHGARVNLRFVYSDSSFVHDGVTALMWASDAGALSTVRLLLAHGADVRSRSFSLRGARPPRLPGQTALELAEDPRVAALIRNASGARRSRRR